MEATELMGHLFDPECVCDDMEPGPRTTVLISIGNSTYEIKSVHYCNGAIYLGVHDEEN